jgi:hypothetical protein
MNGCELCLLILLAAAGVQSVSAIFFVEASCQPGTHRPRTVFQADCNACLETSSGKSYRFLCDTDTVETFSDAFCFRSEKNMTIAARDNERSTDCEIRGMNIRIVVFDSGSGGLLATNRVTTSTATLFSLGSLVSLLAIALL